MFFEFALSQKSKLLTAASPSSYTKEETHCTSLTKSKNYFIRQIDLLLTVDFCNQLYPISLRTTQMIRQSIQRYAPSVFQCYCHHIPEFAAMGFDMDWRCSMGWAQLKWKGRTLAQDCPWVGGCWIRSLMDSLERLPESCFTGNWPIVVLLIF